VVPKWNYVNFISSPIREFCQDTCGLFGLGVEVSLFEFSIQFGVNLIWHGFVPFSGGFPTMALFYLFMFRNEALKKATLTSLKSKW